MVKRLIVPPLLLILAAPVCADVFLEATVMGVDTRTWTSGMRNRMEVPGLILGGQLTIVTRLDRDMKWTLDSQGKLYEEEPVAMPYQPRTEQDGPASEETTLREQSFFHKEECTGTVTRLPKRRTIAGYPATGYQITCAERPQEGMIVWLTPPAGRLAQVKQETGAYEAAYVKARYANYPPEEQLEFALGMSMLSDLLGAVFTQMLQNDRQLASGFPLAVAGFGQAGERGQGQPTTIYEVKQISTALIDPGLFRIPTGYRTVDNLVEMRMRKMVEEMKVKGLLDDVKNILQRTEETGDVWRR